MLRMPPDVGLIDQNQSDYNTALNKALQLVRSPPHPLNPFIDVSIQLDDFTRPEFGFLRRLNEMAAVCLVPAVAAQFPEVQVICNVRNSLIVLERMYITNGNAAVQTVSWGWAGFDGGVTITPEARDSRNFGNPGVAFITRQNTAAPAAPQPTAGFVRLGVDQTVVIELDQVICNPAAGFATSPTFKVLGNQVLTSLNVSLQYRERVLLPTETA